MESSSRRRSRPRPSAEVPGLDPAPGAASVRDLLTSSVGPGPLVAVALHHGHDVRPEVAAALAIDEPTRLREEDPYTGAWTDLAPTRVVVNRSRFEVDLNRPREGSVYTTPDTAWGLNVWDGRLTEELRGRSLRLHDMFYRRLEMILRWKMVTEGAFVVFDLHSYNHRPAGPDGPVADPRENPDVNLGTGHLDRRRWGRVVEAFLDAAARPDATGARLDVRENVRFQGGYLSRWVAERFPARGCTLAVEVKKTFMDEWTGALDLPAFLSLGARLAGTTASVLQALRTVRSADAGGRRRR